MNKPKKSKEAGARAARQFGAEYQANPGSSRMEYLDSAACYFREGVDRVKDLDKEESAILFREFKEGMKAERECQ